MMNVMEINGVKAIIAFDPEINMLRGGFVGLNGVVDFYSTDIDGLRREGETSLKVFLDMCAEEGVSPYRKTSGRLNLRLSQELYDKAVTLANASGKSLNAVRLSRASLSSHRLKCPLAQMLRSFFS